MSLKKSLKIFRDGQAVFEYLLLFLVVASLALLTVTKVFPKVKEDCNDFFKEAAENIIQPLKK